MKLCRVKNSLGECKVGFAEVVQAEERRGKSGWPLEIEDDLREVDAKERANV